MIEQLAKALLGCAIIENKLIDDLILLFDFCFAKSGFPNDKIKKLYIKIKENVKNNIVTDIVTLSDEATIAIDCENSCVSAVNYDSYRRQLLKICKQLELSRAVASGEDVEEKIKKIEAEYSKYKDKKELKKFEAKSYEEYLFSEKLFLSSGFAQLDNILNGGFLPKDYIVIAGTPGAGKTTLSCNFVSGFLNSNFGKIAFLSYEMYPQLLIDKLISMRCSLLQSKFQKNEFTDDEKQKIKEETSNLENQQLYFIDESVLISDLKKIVEKNKIKVLILDYLQIAKNGLYGKTETETDRISRISQQLKYICNSCGIILIAISQLIKTANKSEPMLSDLRGSGQIAQDADVVLGLFADPDDEKKMKIKILKNRRGQYASVELAWSNEFGRFENI